MGRFLRAFWLVLGAVMAAVAGLPAQAGEAPLSQLLRLKDDADPALISVVAAQKTAEAAEGLSKLYDQVSSLLMQREVLQALVGFAGAPEGESIALRKVALVAGNATDADLRDIAIAGLGQAPRAGKPLLRQLVDGELPDFIREPALREHVRHATADDLDWYRHLWNLKNEQRKDKEGKIAGPELGPIRRLAFEGASRFLSEDELVETLRRELLDTRIRRAALATMQARNLPKTAAMADWVLQRVDFPGRERAEAAQLLCDRDGAKVANLFLDLAKKRDTTPEDLRQTMAELLAKLGDDATDKKLAKLVGKGKPHERVFALVAAGRHADLKLVRKELLEPAIEVRRAAVQALVARGDRESLAELRQLLAKGKLPGDQRLAIEGIGALERGNDTWLQELAGFATHADADVRNAGLEQIGQGRNRAQLPVLLTALEHADWSTRWAAVEGLLAMRDAKAVGPLIARLAKDPGRLGRHIADVLWQFTAQPHGEDAARWQAWWSNAEKGFELVTAQALEQAERARELTRLRQRTSSASNFFGLQIDSQRVLFIVDVSGSMLESMYGRYVGKRGATRIDVAKQQLQQAIQSLEPGALFNIYAFSSGVEKWRPDVLGSDTPALRQAALQWVDRLGAMGATNLFDSLKLAFADKEVDAIYLMSDGEPTNGELIDPARIRAEVAFWNQHRKVKIHTVAIGANLEVLEWLAQDSGGKHVKMR